VVLGQAVITATPTYSRIKNATMIVVVAGFMSFMTFIAAVFFGDWSYVASSIMLCCVVACNYQLQIPIVRSSEFVCVFAASTGLTFFWAAGKNSTKMYLIGLGLAFVYAGVLYRWLRYDTRTPST
jgi:hypothetical protein